MCEHLLTTQQAATFLGASPRTLEDWRLRGGGPVYRKIGRRLVRYCDTDLSAFIASGARLNTGMDHL
ncbi:helix-turn-helix transcriptional regulator [Asticcacaulis solisilvae]|uniref:helix-turn-helix transcriptional regulator n=1 Tax=Asticcacaulis solisilvae TaxID=1217274 RepID=UPI003FD89239